MPVKAYYETDSGELLTEQVDQNAQDARITADVKDDHPLAAIEMRRTGRERDGIALRPEPGQVL